MKKLTKKQIREYRDAFEQIVQRAGATARPMGGCYELAVETQAGPLFIARPQEDCWIACRFGEVDRAVALLNPGRVWDHHLNPHSGKWNWMGGDCHEGNMTDLAYFQQALRRIAINWNTDVPRGTTEEKQHEDS